MEPTSRAGGPVSTALRPVRAFDAASRMVVGYLARVAPLGVWAVTRVVDGRQILLVTEDRGYGFMRPGAEFPWATSMCRTMVGGTSPRIARDTAATPSLIDAVRSATAQSVPVGAYVGTPIVHPDGGLFGTLCAYHPDPVGAELAVDDELLDVFSSLLSAVLEADLAATETERALEQAVGEAESDPLTGLLNRRGWERWLAREEDRFRRFGEPASVVMMDLDVLKEVNDTDGHAAGDRYIRSAADVLRRTVRSVDALARLGGDEFAMVVRCGPDEAHRLVDRLQDALEDAGVPGSLGFAPYGVVAGFPGACAAADAAMYRDKQHRRAARG